MKLYDSMLEYAKISTSELFRYAMREVCCVLLQIYFNILKYYWIDVELVCWKYNILCIYFLIVFLLDIETFFIIITNEIAYICTTHHKSSC